MKGKINLEVLNSKQSISNRRLVVSVGAGRAQLPFIKAIKDRGFLVAAFGKGRNDLNAIELCDFFKEIDTSDCAKAIEWLNELPIKVSAAGSFAGGVAIKTLNEICYTFNLPTKVPSDLIIGMNKFDQQKLYEKYQLTTIKTFSFKKLKDKQNLINLVQGKDSFIIKPAIGRGSSGVRKVDSDCLFQLIKDNSLSDKDIIQESIVGEEYRTLIIVQNSELKLLAPIKRNSFHNTFLLGRLSYNSDEVIQIKDYIKKMIKNLKLSNAIIKADIIVTKENINMIEMDIGVGGGIYYKKYISHLFDYDIQEEYINLISGMEVKKCKGKGKKVVMDYVYNLTGKPIMYSESMSMKKLSNILGKEIILIPNLLHPEDKGRFSSNADFIFCIIHNNDKISNLELNRYVNNNLFNIIKE